MRFFTTTKSNLISKFFAFSAFAVTAILFTSCGKGTDYSIPQKGYLTITNAAPSLASYNVYIDNNKLNSGALPFGGAFSYLALDLGDHTIKFTTGSSTEKIIDKSISFSNQQNFSLFLLKQPTNEISGLEFLQVEDKLKPIVKGKAQIRFINLSLDAPAMGLLINDDADKDQVSFIENKAYKQSSDFIELDAKSYVFHVKNSTPGTPNATIAKTELKEGKIYTIMVIGLVTPGEKEKAFTAKIYSN